MLDIQAALKRRRAIRWKRREEKLVKCEHLIEKVWAAHFRREMMLVLRALRQNWANREQVMQLIRSINLKSSKVVAIDRLEAGAFSEGIWQAVNVYLFGKFFDWFNNKSVPQLEQSLETSFKTTGITVAVDSAANAGMKFRGFPAATQRFIDQHIPKIVGDIELTTRKMILSEVVEGLDAGESYKEMAIRIREVYGEFTRARAFRIARNEAGMIAAQTEWDMWAESPHADRILKVWRDSGDDRVREYPYDHRLDGETLPREELFSNGLRFPRDPEGDAGNIINCRCWLEWELP